MNEKCEHCGKEFTALSKVGHLRKCEMYLNARRENIQACVCKYKFISLAERKNHRLVCEKWIILKSSPITPEIITCTACGCEKNSDEFFNNKIRKNGKDAKCKKCRSLERKEYDRNSLNAISRQNYSPEKKKEYYDANREKILTNKTEYWKENKEKISERVRDWRIVNHETLSKKAKEYRESIKDRLFELLGNSCVMCGCKDKNVLTVNHVNENTDKNLGSMVWKRKILRGERDAANYKILCKSCKNIKNGARK